METNAHSVEGREIGRRRMVWISMALLMAMMSLFFSLAMFVGLERHSGYYGNAYQALYPGSFPNDPCMLLTRPTMLSMLYLVVKPFGRLWLDDRFTIIVFALLAFISLVGIDKTAQLLGACHLGERIAILSLMLLGHQILDNHAIAIDSHEFNPTTFAAPIIIWLLYQSLAGRRPLVILLLMVFAVWVSVKNAWLPILIALVLLAKDRLALRGRIVVATTFIVLGGLAGLGYYAFLRPTDGTDVALFDYILRYLDQSEANPFMNPWIGNLMFVAICVTGVFLKGLPVSMLARIRTVGVVGLVLWLGGGLYLSYAPDAFKIPYLIPFDVTRALWWPQYVLFMAFGVALLKWLQRASSWAGVGVSWALLMVLYLLHSEWRGKLAAVAVGVTLAMVLAYRREGRLRGAEGRPGARRWWALVALNPERRLRIVAVSMCLGAVSLYGVGAFHRRLDALKFLALHGVMGDNPGAVWVGVNEYLRERTPASATVLALAARDALGREHDLQYEGSLRTRAGRSMPLGHPASFYFDYEKLKWLDAQREHVQVVVEAWGRHDRLSMVPHLRALGAPDYLVAPIDHSQWLGGDSHPEYQLEATVGDFFVFRRRDLR